MSKNSKLAKVALKSLISQSGPMMASHQMALCSQGRYSRTSTLLLQALIKLHPTTLLGRRLIGVDMPQNFQSFRWLTRTQENLKSTWFTGMKSNIFNLSHLGWSLTQKSQPTFRLSREKVLKELETMKRNHPSSLVLSRAKTTIGTLIWVLVTWLMIREYP